MPLSIWGPLQIKQTNKQTNNKQTNKQQRNTETNKPTNHVQFSLA